MRLRNSIVYTLLATTWLATLVWQHAEHDRVGTRLRASLANRAADTFKSLDIMLRSLRSFGGFIPGSRLEIALQEMVKSDELLAVSLYNRSLNIIAAAGDDPDFSPMEMPETGQLWLERRALFQQAVDLGTSTFGTNSRPREAIVRPSRTEEERTRDESPAERRKRLEQARQYIESRLRSIDTETNSESLTSTNGRPRRGFLFRRHSSMSQEQFEADRQEYGVYGAVFQMNTAGMQVSIEQDKWLRTCIVAFAFVAFFAMGMAWRNVTRSSEIELRLIRAREQNTHLKDMNMAAAGLAHETRNPLNLIRGMAQMISKEENASDVIRKQCSEITSEVDRVTGQLNEFINFSKPPEIRRTTVDVRPLIEDVMRPLRGELEDQGVEVDLPTDGLQIEADEKMLRQVIFNITLNAVQALEEGGRISIQLGDDEQGAWIVIGDNGPGIAEEHRDKIFQPYFTTREKVGTGLGLAIVRQIVQAHGWEIAYQPSASGGAEFRLSRIKKASA